MYIYDNYNIDETRKNRTKKQTDKQTNKQTNRRQVVNYDLILLSALASTIRLGLSEVGGSLT